MDPAPLEHRRWTSWTFFAYWISDLITPGGWATSSSFVEMGLTWWESCLAMYVGGFLVAIVITGEFQKLHSCMVSATSIAYQASQFSQWYHWCQGKFSNAMLPTISFADMPTCRSIRLSLSLLDRSTATGVPSSSSFPGWLVLVSGSASILGRMSMSLTVSH